MLWQRRRHLAPWIGRLAIIAILPLAVVTLAYPIVEIFDLDIMGPPRYFLALMPGAVLVGSWALMQLRRRLIVHAAVAALALVSAWRITTIHSDLFRERVQEYFGPQYKPGDGVIVIASEITDGVQLYRPGTIVDLALNRWEVDTNVLRQQLAPLSNRETVWMIWYRGGDSPALDVAKSMWGDFTSNKPKKRIGSLRVYKFQPRL